MQPTPAAITLARQRLGWQVMARLLEEAAGPLAGQEQERRSWSGMRLAAVDGMCLDLPDTPENGAEFGYPGNDAGPGPFPQIRVVGLGECGTRAVLGAAPSPLATGEQPLARQLLPGSGPVTCCWPTGTSCPTACSTMCSRPGCMCCGARKRRGPPGAARCCPTARTCHGSPTRKPPVSCAARAPIRAIFPASQSGSSSTQWKAEDGSRDLGDLHPGHRHPRSRAADPGQAAAAYASRWQLETCFDELETSIRGGAAVVLRSKSPPMIRQEIYAMLCCYQAIRTLISHAAATPGIDPGRSPLPAPATGSAAASATRVPFPLTALTSSRRPGLRDHLPRNLVPGRPGRRYARETKRPGGRYKTRKPGQTARLTPLTMIMFWLMPVPP